jgi:hypothetical protein
MVIYKQASRRLDDEDWGARFDVVLGQGDELLAVSAKLHWRGNFRGDGGAYFDVEAWGGALTAAFGKQVAGAALVLAAAHQNTNNTSRLTVRRTSLHMMPWR